MRETYTVSDNLIVLIGLYEDYRGLLPSYVAVRF